MSGFNANDQHGGGAPRKKAPPLDVGTYPTRLVGLMNLGLQPQRPFEGQDKPPAVELQLTYEFLDEFVPDDNGDPDPTKPRWLSETFPFHNLSSDKAKSTKRYGVFDPEGKDRGDWTEQVGKPVNVSVVVKDGTGKAAGNVYENVGSISPMRPKEAAVAPPLVNKPRVFNFYDPDIQVFLALPEWIQEKMKNALDYGGSALEKALQGHVDKGPAKEPKPKERPPEPPADADEGDGDW